MTIFEYVMVLLSMVLSLSLTQLVSGVGELARSRDVRWSLAHALWIAVGFGLILDVWTSYWLIRDVPRWDCSRSSSCCCRRSPSICSTCGCCRAGSAMSPSI